MSVLFTQHAFDRMKDIALKPAERQQLGHPLSAVDAATGPSDLAAVFPGTASLVKGARGGMLVVLRGAAAKGEDISLMG